MICIDCNQKETKTKGCRWCNNCLGKRWRKKNPQRSREILEKARIKFAFGGNREKVLERDDFKCVLCDMTRGEHKRKWNKDLGVHHIDGKGSGHRVKNNNLDNLATLCMVCHRKIEIADAETNGKRLFRKSLEERGLWSENFKSCVVCNGTASTHQSKGVCNRCYQMRRLEYKKIKQREYTRKWKAEKRLKKEMMLITPSFFEESQ